MELLYVKAQPVISKMVLILIPVVSLNQHAVVMLQFVHPKTDISIRTRKTPYVPVIALRLVGIQIVVSIIQVVRLHLHPPVQHNTIVLLLQPLVAVTRVLLLNAV